MAVHLFSRWARVSSRPRSSRTTPRFQTEVSPSSVAWNRICSLASILEGRRDGGSSCGEDSGHLVPRKREEALYNDRIELGSTRLGEPANGFLERQTFTVRTRRNHGVKGVCH